MTLWELGRGGQRPPSTRWGSHGLPSEGKRILARTARSLGLSVQPAGGWVEEGTVQGPTRCQESMAGNKASFSRSGCGNRGPCFILTTPKPPWEVLCVNPCDHKGGIFWEGITETSGRSLLRPVCFSRKQKARSVCASATKPSGAWSQWQRQRDSQLLSPERSLVSPQSARLTRAAGQPLPGGPPAWVF